ncbi:MAG TPA: hypothetical protein VFB14_18520 [Bryobacteraceae bacterium]|jgi:hypothetical protein|nr:hypothetical protein [Bryobacteraceae bacterium]
MALSAAEIDSLIVDLDHQYEQLSREYSEIPPYERKIELSDLMASIEYQLAALEEQRRELSNERCQKAVAG